jgi:MFS family permease
MRMVFWVAVIPAFIAVLLVIVGVENVRSQTGDKRAPMRLSDLGKLGSAFWKVVFIGVLFSLARISEAFLILRANGEGLPLALTPLVLVGMNVVYAVGAYPAGILSDRFPPRRLLLLGITALVASHVVLGFADGLLAVFVGVALWGIHMALTQGILSRMIADSAPEPLVASAFGIYSLLTGLALLVGSVLAGLLWDMKGSHITFYVAAGLASAAALALAIFRDTPPASPLSN